MTERREDLSTADLAGQQPADTAPHDRAAPADLPDRDPTDDELRREDLTAEALTRDTTVVEDRPSDQGPATTPADAPAAQAGLPVAPRAPRLPPAHCWPPRMPRDSGPAGPTSRPGSSTPHGGRSSRPTPWWPS